MLRSVLNQLRAMTNKQVTPETHSRSHLHQPAISPTSLIAGLVVSHLFRPGDTIAVDLPHHAGDDNGLLAVAMPPSQSLQQRSLVFIAAYLPLPRTHFHRASILRKVIIREKYHRWRP